MKIKPEVWALASKDIEDKVSDLLSSNNEGIRDCVSVSGTATAIVNLKVKVCLTAKAHEVDVKFVAEPVTLRVKDKRHAEGEDPDQIKLALPPIEGGKSLTILPPDQESRVKRGRGRPKKEPAAAA